MAGSRPPPGDAADSWPAGPVCGCGWRARRRPGRPAQVPGRGGELGEFGVMPPGADEDAERLPPGPPRVIHGPAGTRPPRVPGLPRIGPASSWSRTSSASRSRTRCWRRRISETMRGSGPPTWPN